MLFACKGAHNLFTGQRERERGIKTGREKARESEKEDERDVEYG
jgi:hypothetical protein